MRRGLAGRHLNNKTVKMNRRVEEERPAKWQSFRCRWSWYRRCNGRFSDPRGEPTRGRWGGRVLRSCCVTAFFLARLVLQEKQKDMRRGVKDEGGRGKGANASLPRPGLDSTTTPSKESRLHVFLCSLSRKGGRGVSLSCFSCGWPGCLTMILRSPHCCRRGALRGGNRVLMMPHSPTPTPAAPASASPRWLGRSENACRAASALGLGEWLQGGGAGGRLFGRSGVCSL